MTKESKGQKVRKEDFPELQVSLGATIKAERLRLGVTQEQLAGRAEMHRTYLADIERGGRNITLRSITNLARALQVSIEFLLTNSGAFEASAPHEFMEVLLVEDNPNDAELTVQAFKRAGLTNHTKVVGLGREALDYLNNAGQHARGRGRTLPQLVLLDLNLPDISGIDVLREMKSRAETKDVPVVVLSSSQDDWTILECARLGAHHYIIKPVGFENLSKVTPKLQLEWALVKRRVQAETTPTPT